MTATAAAPPDLAARLAGARAAEAPLRERVAELEGTLHQAVAASDYDTAARLQRDLPAARAELVCAGAATASLQAGQDLIDRQQQAEREAIEVQRLRDEARARVPLHQQAEREGFAELDRLAERLTADIRTLQATMRAVTAAEAGVGQARNRLAGDLVACGDRPGPVMPVPPPNRLSAQIENDPTLRRIRDWAGR